MAQTFGKLIVIFLLYPLFYHFAGSEAGKSPTGIAIVMRNLRDICGWLIIVTGSALLSWHIAVNVEGTDFPVFYTAAKHFVDREVSIETIFRTSMEGRGILPERYPPGNYFIYSPIVAALFSPLAFLPYFQAKATMMFINVMAYFISIKLILHMLGRPGWRYLTYAVLFMWLPFIINFCAAQVNAILLLLVVTALCFVDREKPILGGLLLSIAALFKLFPLVIALFSGTSRYQIATTCFAIFALALLVPGSGLWLQTIPTVSSGHTPVFLFTSRYGFGWFILYSIIVVATSLLILFRAKQKDPLMTMAYAVPAALTAMPVVQYHHLIMLSITYTICFLSDFPLKDNKWLGWFLAGTLIHINLNGLFNVVPSSYWSILTVWIVMSLNVYSAHVPTRP